MSNRYGQLKNFLFSPWTRFASTLLALVLIIVLLSRSQQGLPAVGELINPFTGLWNHRVSFWEKTESRLKIPGLKGRVTVQVDRDQIKHIFAENDEDLYLAQGYVVASERLWQMEFLSRVAGGRLSEVMGRRTIEFDKYFTRLGLPQAAKESAEIMLNDPVTGPALRAYAAGVNAYIAQLKPEDYPFEYKLLGHKPETWMAENAALLMKYMAYDLSGYNRELALSRSRSRLSKSDFDELFPLQLGIEEPIVPKGTKFNFASRSGPAPQEDFLPDLRPLDPIPQPDPSNGSNNWAVLGRKSTTGKPILSNDIHLGLSLPSLWYEVQLTSPSQNVYGITLPGAPGVILGFNPKLAWGVTNGGTDIMDWYQLRYRDENRSEYLFEKDWRPIISREVQIKIRGEEPLNLLLRQTHFGPIVYDQSETPLNPMTPKGLALKWSALDGSNELKTFLLLNRAKSTAQCREAIENFQAPDQNFLCADHTGDVGLWHMGRYPVRWPGQGRMISDGSSKEYEWQSWLPRTEVPSSRNPARGFLSSANQAPADETYPHYLGWPFESVFRGARINELLRERKKIFSPEDLRAMQGDTLSVLARTASPLLVGAVEAEPSLNETEKQIVDLLKKWDFKYSEDAEAPTIFEAWYQDFETRMWSPHFPDRGLYQYPPALKTLRLMASDPQSKWFDDPQTQATERMKDVALLSLRSAIKNVSEKLGSYKPGKWLWPKVHKTEFRHIAKLPGLGREDFVAPGVAENIFANKGTHGPVWKLVVAVGAKPEAWAVYPGGQSGDPTSRHYDDFLEAWRRNELKEVSFLSSASDLGKRNFKTVEASGEGESK